MPAVSKGRRGPKPRWRQRRKPPLTFVHVNQQIIRRNCKSGDRAPVITVKRAGSNIYGHEVEISGPCRVVYRPDSPLNSGAQVWIETLATVNVNCLEMTG